MRQMNLTNVALLSLLMSCSIFGHRRIENGITKSRFLTDGAICYKIFVGKDFAKDSGEAICTDRYPQVSGNDKVILIHRHWQPKLIELEKLKSFESFMSSFKDDPNAIAAYGFNFFEQRKLIDHKKYKKLWSKNCPENGLSCRLLAYLQKAEGDQSNFFNLMEKGCADYDIISCFNILMRKTDITKTEEKKLKKHIKPACLKVKDNDAYHDVCGELLLDI